MKSPISHFKAPIFSLAFILAIGFFVYAFLYQIIQPNNPAQPNPIQNLADMIVYTSPNRTFSIYYPPPWQIQESTQAQLQPELGTIIDSAHLAPVTATDSTSGLSIFSLKDLQIPEIDQIIQCQLQIFDCIKKDFNQHSFTQITMPLSNSPQGKIFASKANRIYYFIIIDTDPDLPIPPQFQSILQTFTIMSPQP